MSPKRKIIPAAIALIVILGAGLVHGVTTFRWTAASELKAAGEKLTKIPLTIGDWVGKDAPLDKRQETIGQISASVSRQYVNTKTGQAVTILLVCGRPGPISVHTPEVCYAGSGYEIASERKRESFDYGDSKAAQFWSIKVNKPDVMHPERMIIDYGWFAKQAWSAPEADARFSFAGVPVLYKLYTIREQARPNDRSGTDVDPAGDFLKDFLPVLQKTL